MHWTTLSTITFKHQSPIQEQRKNKTCHQTMNQKLSKSIPKNNNNQKSPKRERKKRNNQKKLVVMLLTVYSRVKDQSRPIKE